MDNGYNGYKNYETWNLNLWASNDEATYKTIIANQPYTRAKAIILASRLFPDGTPDMNGIEDFEIIDWNQIIKSWNEY